MKTVIATNNQVPACTLQAGDSFRVGGTHLTIVMPVTNGETERLLQSKFNAGRVLVFSVRNNGPVILDWIGGDTLVEPVESVITYSLPKSE